MKGIRRDIAEKNLQLQASEGISSSHDKKTCNRYLVCMEKDLQLIMGLGLLLERE